MTQAIFASINKKLVNKDLRNVGKSATGWTCPESGYTYNDFVEHVTQYGHAFSWVFKDGKRAGGNFVKSNVLALDFEPVGGGDGMAWEAAQTHSWLKKAAAFLYTTDAHGKKGNRFRAVFVTDGMIEDALLFEKATRALAGMFQGQVDTHATDAARIFFGNSKALVANFGNVLALDELRALMQTEPAAVRAEKTGANIGSQLLSGMRNTGLATIAGSIYGHGYGEAAGEAMLQAYNVAYCVPPLPQAEVSTIAQSIWKKARRDVVTANLPLNDYGMIARIERSLDIRENIFVPALGWHYYADGLWHEDTRDVKISSLVFDTLYTTLMAELQQAEEGGDEKTAKALAGALKTYGTKMVAPLVKLLTTKWTVDAAELDKDRSLVALKNGVFNLSTYELAQHSALVGYHTIAMNVAYDGAAQCPQWEAFIRDIFPDEELRAYVQRVVGYVLLGDNSLQRFFIGRGATGANGKSTFINVLSHILGKYAVGQPASQFLNRKDAGAESASPNMMRLKHARLIKITEFDKNAQLAEEHVKSLTGGDVIVARPLYGKPVEFTVRGTFIAIGNWEPRISSSGNAIWRRIEYIPFDVSVPMEKRIPNLEEVLLTESAGIFNWIVEGVKMFRRVGLATPAIAKERAEIMAEQQGNEVTEYIAEALEITRDAADTVLAKELYGRFCEWYQSTGHSEKYKPSARSFNQQLDVAGAVKKKSNKGLAFLGVKYRASVQTAYPF